MNPSRSTLRLSVAAVSLLLVAGCVQSQATLLDPTPRARLSEDQVRVYRTLEAVECDFTEVALIHTQGEASATSDAQMISAARKRAARAGANGLALGEFEAPGAAERIADAVLHTGAKRRGELLAVSVEPCESN